MGAKNNCTLTICTTKNYHFVTGKSVSMKIVDNFDKDPQAAQAKP